MYTEPGCAMRRLGALVNISEPRIGARVGGIYLDISISLVNRLKSIVRYFVSF